jgi:CMP-N-acetylneuraminic acid synthetase
MSALAVILARGGSKGIPRKNLMPVGGVSLLVRAVRAAKACPRLDGVLVSTDSDEIAETALQAGACVVRRPSRPYIS